MRENELRYSIAKINKQWFWIVYTGPGLFASDLEPYDRPPIAEGFCDSREDADLDAKTAYEAASDESLELIGIGAARAAQSRYDDHYKRKAKPVTYEGEEYLRSTSGSRYRIQKKTQKFIYINACYTPDADARAINMTGDGETFRLDRVRIESGENVYRGRSWHGPSFVSEERYQQILVEGEAREQELVQWRENKFYQGMREEFELFGFDDVDRDIKTTFTDVERRYEEMLPYADDAMKIRMGDAISHLMAIELLGDMFARKKADDESNPNIIRVA